MDRSTPIYLIDKSYAQNEDGVMIATETKRKVFANVGSVSASEWFEGGRNGLNPQFRMTMFAYDYHKEQVIEFNGTRYTVYRTYFGRNDTIELYVELRKGNADAVGEG